MSKQTIRVAAAAFGVVAAGIASSATAAVIPGTSLTPNAWYAADNAANTSSGGVLQTLADLSGNGNNANQPTAANRPALTGNAVNGLPTATFGGAALLDMGTALASSAYTAFAVIRPSVPTSTNEPRTFISSASNDAGFQYRIGGDNVGNGNRQQLIRRGAQNAGSSLTDVGTAGFSVVDVGVTSAAAGGNGTFRLNGANDGTVAPSAAFTGGINVIGSRGGTSEGFKGDIAEVVLFSSQLSVAERQSVENYLGSKYAITVPEPTGLAGVAAATVGLLVRRRRR